MTPVVILSSQSLLTEGVAASLRQVLGGQTLQVFDPQSAEALTQIIAARPEIVILEGNPASARPDCKLEALVSALPAVTIVRLDPDHNQVQVVTSYSRQLTQVRDLLDVIRPPTGAL